MFILFGIKEVGKHHKVGIKGFKTNMQKNTDTNIVSRFLGTR